MTDYCAFSANHNCLLWMEYELQQAALEEAHELCHGNWIEIQRKERYIEALQQLLDDHQISYPTEYDV